jgi:hypothetical protein
VSVNIINRLKIHRTSMSHSPPGRSFAEQQRDFAHMIAGHGQIKPVDMRPPQHIIKRPLTRLILLDEFRLPTR